eukprot:TRINITY_DN71545_c0_g1_i1.p1 TRINITY_DN71545_c0_g1~~TRINITY_DN71545_c0_g1_i1.p1  ORF type:complete len:357 (-),score=74.33 TRINITY_DN71545_c0_g1_i1:288-1358(-)
MFGFHSHSLFDAPWGQQPLWGAPWGSPYPQFSPAPSPFVPSYAPPLSARGAPAFGTPSQFSTVGGTSRGWGAPSRGTSSTQWGGSARAAPPARKQRPGITLFIDNAHISFFARACLYVLELAREQTGLEFKVCPIDLLGGQTKSPEYLSITPTGQVPALRDDDLYLFESAAIIRYLATKFGLNIEGHAADPACYGKTQSVIEYIRNKVMSNAATIVFNHYVKPKLGQELDLAAVAKAKSALADGLAFCEKFFFQQDPRFLVGTHLTTADILLSVTLKQLDLVHSEFDYTEYPVVFRSMQYQASTDAFAVAHRLFNKHVACECLPTTGNENADGKAPGADLSDEAADDAPTPDVPTL